MDYKTRRSLKSILNSWYGEKRGVVELTSFQAQPVPISPVIDKLLEGLIPQCDMEFAHLSKEWGQLVGTQIEKVAQPLAIEGAILYVEVTHSAWLRELNGPTKSLIIKNINELLGKGFCTDMKFIPAGGRCN